MGLFVRKKTPFHVYTGEEYGEALDAVTELDWHRAEKAEEVKALSGDKLRDMAAESYAIGAVVMSHLPSGKEMPPTDSALHFANASALAGLAALAYIREASQVPAE